MTPAAAIEHRLEDDGGSGGVKRAIAFAGGGRGHRLGLGGRQPLIGFRHRDGKLVAQRPGEFAHFSRLCAAGPFERKRHADDDFGNSLQLNQAGNLADGCPAILFDDGGTRVGHQPKVIRNGHADARSTGIKGE